MTSELAPGLLVAAPSMNDPNFAGAVVLLIEANDDGAMGFVINRTMDVTFDDIADELDIEVHERRAEAALNYGGPVQSERGWLLLERRADQLPLPEAAMSIEDRLDIITSLDSLREALVDPRDLRLKLMLGYAGWGPRQLEEELREGVWLPLAFDEALIFDVEGEDAWRQAVERLGLSPGFLWGNGVADA